MEGAVNVLDDAIQPACLAPLGHQLPGEGPGLHAVLPNVLLRAGRCGAAGEPRGLTGIVAGDERSVGFRDVVTRLIYCKSKDSVISLPF